MMSVALAASFLVKATIIAFASLLVAWLMRRARASVRHVGLAAGFFALLALPIAAVVGPTAAIDVPVVVSVTSAEPPDVAGLLAGPVLAQEVPTAVTPVDQDAGARSLDGMTLLLGVWALGVLVCLAPVCAGLYQLRRYRRCGIPFLSEQTGLRKLAAALGIKRSVTLLVHESIAGPMTYGVMRPVVLLPSDSRQWSRSALRRALVHELEHVRRADCLIHCASRLVCALYWFHPLVWTMWRKLTVEAERACDDAVLGEAEPTRYARQLVDLAERLAVEPKRPVLAMASRDELTTRIAAVLDSTLPRGRAGLAGIVVVAVTVVFVAALAPLRAVTLSMPHATAAPRAEVQLSIAAHAPTSAEVAFLSRAQAQAPVTAAQAPSQAPPASVLSFEVASVKVNKSGDRAVGAPPVVGGRFLRTNIPIDVLIANAYQPLQRFEIEGMPEWATTTRVDLEARALGPVAGEVAPAGATPAQIGQMLQSLLAERFKLAVHREVRQQPVYAWVQVTPGRMGRQLKSHTDDAGCLDPRSAPQAGGRPDPNLPLPTPPCGAFSGAPALGRLAGQRVALDSVGRALSGQLGRMVIDRTGLMGLFDLTLEWTPLQALPGLDPNAGAGASIGPADRPSIFTAVQEQLGLKLDPQTGPVNMLVIDHVELPSEN
ncbi:MAG: M56 family metallopeptidase [Vicinamibacterales bacterium]